MALPKEADRFADAQNRVEEFFEPQLRKLGLSVDDINHQDLAELQKSLETVNEAIAHPESFATLKLSVTASALFITKSDAYLEVGVLPVLLERKRLILRRIAELRGEQKIDNLRDLVGQVADEDLKAVLEKEVAELESTKQYQEQAAEVEKQRDSVLEGIEAQRQTMMLELEKFERKSQVWRAFLERESVATIVGGVLLLLLAAVLTVAMFTNVAASAVISNSFLLILGYFFGQTVARGSTGGNT